MTSGEQTVDVRKERPGRTKRESPERLVETMNAKAGNEPKG